MAEFDFIAFVQNLPKEKLVELVLKYAPESYREKVSNQNLNEEKARKVFNIAVKEMHGLFEDEELLYEPSEFASSIEAFSEKLTGFWDRYPDETGELFLFCLKRIEEIQEEGLLYNHYYDEVLDGRGFLTVIQNFTAQLPFDQKMKFIAKLEQVLDQYSYDTFYNYQEELQKIYKENELPMVRKMFVESIGNDEKPFRKAYYNFFKGTLNYEEKEFVLTKIYHLDNNLCLELVDTLVVLQKPEDAVNYLLALRESNPNPWVFTETMFFKMIQLKFELGQSIIQDLIDGLNTYSTHTFLKHAIQYVPDRKKNFEDILLAASHHHFLRYLLGYERVEEAYHLVKNSKTLDDRSVYHFYSTYGKKYPEDATKYFIQLINKELPFSGEQHYESIVKSLKHIKKWNASKTNEIVEMLRKEYKRRRNLMKMLEDF